MALNEVTITRAIVETYTKKLLAHLDVDVAVVGGGPSGLVAAYFLARGGKKVALYERKLSIGGGMWGGGMMFNEIVVQAEAKGILDHFGVRTEEYEPGYFTADAIEAVTTICSRAVQAGAKVFNCITVEDVVIRDNRVMGLVITDRLVDEIGEGAYDFVDALGIFEYIPDHRGRAATFLRNLYRLVRPGGTLVLGNMLDSHPQLAFNQYGIGWPSIHPRSRHQLLDLMVAAGVPLDEAVGHQALDGVYAVVELRKPESTRQPRPVRTG